MRRSRTSRSPSPSTATRPSPVPPTTDSTGTATCDITATEPSNTYTLSASFPGDSTHVDARSAPTAATTTFTVNPDTSSVTYTGPTTAVNGEPTTLTGTLTTDTPTPDTPLPAKVVTFTHRLGFDVPVLQRDHRRQRRRPVHHRVRRPAHQQRPDHDHLQRRQLRHADLDHDAGRGQRTDLADGQCGNGRLRRRHDGVGRPDRLGHQRAHQGEPVTLTLNGTRDLHRDD